MKKKFVSLVSPMEMLDRLKNVLGFKGHGSEKKLAEWLEITPESLGMWRKRGHVDCEILLTKCLDFDLNYIIKGKKSTNSYDNDNDDSQNQKKLLAEIEELKKNNLILTTQNELLRDQVYSVLTRSSSERGAVDRESEANGDSLAKTKQRPKAGLG